ncbi:RidA family protein [Streptomyces sp. NBC_00536]|uniref:RidA family protein n=1 Tax=Streptomyces sp. NBC_00536 TaxID=2975769 RepID=UPI002E81A1D0|nr:RidA family protein [Streptomyces sp. NBC_00536]WUC79604.1 RidA family protein [Streptomyces sp. NBC_00536]
MGTDTTTAVSSAEARFQELGLSFPASPKRMGNFVSAVRVGDLLFLSGQGSHDHLGKVGVDLDIDTAYEAARECALRLLGLVKDELGSLDRVKRVVKLLGFVNCEAGFDRSPLIINGASDLLVEVFGDSGRHARSAFGAIALPHNFAVEIEMIVQIES